MRRRSTQLKGHRHASCNRYAASTLVHVHVVCAVALRVLQTLTEYYDHCCAKTRTCTPLSLLCDECADCTATARTCKASLACSRSDVITGWLRARSSEVQCRRALVAYVLAMFIASSVDAAAQPRRTAHDQNAGNDTIMLSSLLFS